VIGRLDYSALAALDLGHLAAARGQAEESIRWVAMALPLLERLHYDQEGLTALRLFREALAEGAFHRTIVEHLRKHAALLLAAPMIEPLSNANRKDP
jgi:hypothetical protein